MLHKHHAAPIVMSAAKEKKTLSTTAVFDTHAHIGVMEELNSY